MEWFKSEEWKNVYKCNVASELVIFIYLFIFSLSASAISAPWHWTQQTMKYIPLKPSTSTAHTTGRTDPTEEIHDGL